MNKINFKEAIKNLLNFKINNNNKYQSEMKPTLINDPSHGFQLDMTDLSSYLRNFLTETQATTMLNYINLTGYLSLDTGEFLREMANDETSALHIKSVHSANIDSIFEQGIRCMGTSSSLATLTPRNIDDIVLENTVTRVKEFSQLISLIKGNNGYRQGGNTIDGTLILKIPKDLPIDEIVYYYNDTDTYNIHPQYIVGFLPVDTLSNVGPMIKPDSKIYSK